MLPVKEESPAGTGLSGLPIFSGPRASAQSTPASTLTNGSRSVLTKPESDILVTASAAAATTASGAILSDTMPTTPPYNPHSTPPPQFVDNADYISRHVATAVAADTPTATPPDDGYMNDAGSNADSECPALEDESPYDALYRDSEFADDQVPAFAQPDTQSTITPQSEANQSPHPDSMVGRSGKIWDRAVAKAAAIEADTEMTDAIAHLHESEIHTSSDRPANDGWEANRGNDRSEDAQNGDTANAATALTELTPPPASTSQPASQSEQHTPLLATPSEDSIATRRPMRMARLSKAGASESPKPARRAVNPDANTMVSAPGSAPRAAGEAASAASAGDDKTSSAAMPARRASKRVSLAAAAATASPVAKQASASAARQAAKPYPKSKGTAAKTAKDAPLPIERRVTRLSGLPTDLSLSQSSPQATASGKRRRRVSDKPTTEELPRELRRLQDTKEFSHVDNEPIVYTVWSNGRYVPANANGEPLVDKNAAKKAKLAKAAEEVEKKKAEEAAAAAAAAAEEKAAAEAALPKKRVKKWMNQGLYAGMPTPSNPAAGLTPAERKELAKLPELSKKYPPNKTLPMPIYNGLRTLIEGRDFKMPFDVFNPLPPGQPKPVKYGRFSKNRFVGEAHAIWKKNPNYDDFQSKCVCKPETGCDEDCQNRIMLYECNDEICNVGPERCSNREFQRLADRTASKNPYHIGVEVFKTLDRGHGIRASRGFRPGQIIMEYIGEIITEEESDRRMNELYKNNACYYLMSFDQSLIIDGTSGSIARFVNHSCSPNCRMIKWIVSGQPRIALFAGDRPIQTGEELTYDYNFDPYSAKNVQGCLCGADNCRGVLGPRKSEKAVSKAAAEKAAAEKASQKAKGANGSSKRKHDAYSMDDDVDTDGATSDPASKKIRVAEAPPKSPIRPVKKPTKAPPPKKVVTTTKAALEALAANAARIARLTKASHAARAVRIAKAEAKRAAEAAAAGKAKRTKAKTSKSAASKTSSAASKPAKVVKVAKSVKVVKTAKGLKASKSSVSKEVKTTTKASKTAKPAKATRTTTASKPTKATKSPARKPAASPTKKTKATETRKKATTPPADDVMNREPMTPQATQATPMAQAVAKAAKAAAQLANAAISAKKPIASRKTSKANSNAYARAKVPVKPLKKSQTKQKSTVTTTKKADVTTTTTTTVTTTSSDTIVKRGRGRPRLATKEPVADKPMNDAAGEAAAKLNEVSEQAPVDLFALDDEEEQLATQFATEAAANTHRSLDFTVDVSNVDDSTLDDSMLDDSTLESGETDDASSPVQGGLELRKPRVRKLSKAQKLRVKRQLVAARRLAAKQDGSYKPKRGPGRPRKYVKIADLQSDNDDTPMAEAPANVPSDILNDATTDAPAPLPSAPAHVEASPLAEATTTESAPRITKTRVEYGVARRADVEEFKAARARARARMERMKVTVGADENTPPVEQDKQDTLSPPPAATKSATPVVAHDVIHVAPDMRVQPV
ncbi:hypothetical protein HMPREF1624_05003 [Sporothrix schenckii ATCC 58251]|uniref:Histone-lysine N-methyltransferase ASH1L n=1 Tax=Sporothrix schenckii (strain ATCC 58251 / de Perez 2211183) TaxID=1391915 RepID=U7PUR4_SPOS1|nr:hypothetical protein HMPREF1624_05003 [Sporothrix schenckii ATCC 58251]